MKNMFKYFMAQAKQAGFWMYFFGFLIFLFALSLLGVALWEWRFVYCLLGLSKKSEVLKYLGIVLKYLGIGIAGLLLMLQALIANKRAKALEDTASAQVVANEHTGQEQRQNRLKNAIEHLESESDSTRLGGTYELFNLACDALDLRQTLLDILCAHIRTKTVEDSYRLTNSSKPSTEIQSLLNLLFRQNYEVFGGLIVDLKGSWLKGSELQEAHLSEAILAGVRLQGADVAGAHLQGADLWGTQLQGASLYQARLHGADLREARLQGTDLQEAQLQGANLQEAWLQGANLEDAKLQGANLEEAQLQGANLQRAQLQGIRPLLEGDTEESNLSKRRHFEERINSGVHVMTNLKRVLFEGGVTEESLGEICNGSPIDAVKGLAEKLRPHVAQPSRYQLPERSKAEIGIYGRDQAEKWISEYPDEPSHNGDSESGS